MAPDEEELLRYMLDDEPLRSGAREHLEQCSCCQQRLAAYKQTHASLLSRLYRSLCPSATQLNHYCIDLLSGEDRFSIANHLRMCPLCASEVLDIRQFLADCEVSFEPPLPFSPRKLVKQILASRVPWQPQIVTRTALPDPRELSWPRQYCAESLNISLHLSRNSDGELILLGLFSSLDADESIENLEGVSVELCRVPVTTAEQDQPQRELLLHTSIDDLGNIVFKSVPSGEYALIVHMPENELVIKGLTIERS